MKSSCQLVFNHSGSSELCLSFIHITTDGQSASLSWNKAPMWGSRPDFYYCQTVAGVLIRGTLSDERTGLSFIIADGPRQRSHFRVRIPWDLWPHFTVSDLRLPFPSPPTTRRATVEVFEPASIRDTAATVTQLQAYSHYITGARTTKKTRFYCRPDKASDVIAKHCRGYIAPGRKCVHGAVA
jgi:hypothetical protein